MTETDDKQCLEHRYHDWNAAIEFCGQMYVYRHELNCDCGLRNFFTISKNPLKHCPNCGRELTE